MPGKSKYDEGTKQYTVRLPDSVAEFYRGHGESLAAGMISVARVPAPEPPSEDVYEVDLPASVVKWYVALGGTLAKGIVESHRMHTDGPFREPLVDASPAFSDSARTEGLEKLAARESVGFSEEYQKYFPLRTETPAEQVVRTQKYGDNVPGVRPRPPHPSYVEGTPEYAVWMSQNNPGFIFSDSEGKAYQNGQCVGDVMTTSGHHLHPPYSGVGTERHGRPLPPIYQGGEDVTPRFKQEKGRKTGSVFAEDRMPEFDDTDGAQEGGEEV